MARTKASVGSKVSSGKSSKARCCAAPPASVSSSSGSTDRGSRNNAGGNPVCPRETPKWQKPITTFFIGKEPSRGDDNGEAAHPEMEEKPATSSRPKRNVILSDDEEDDTGSANTAELDISLQLEPLIGDECHKIEEYYPKNGVKGKGVGKKTKDKENVDSNVVNTRTSLKRDLEESDEEIESVNKKVKVA